MGGSLIARSGRGFDAALGALSLLEAGRSRALEAARAEKTIGASTEASVEIYPNELAAKEQLAPFADELPRLLMLARPRGTRPTRLPRPEGASSGADEGDRRGGAGVQPGQV